MEAKEILTNFQPGGGNPRVTLITPVFNRRLELQRCFESVRKQTYQDFEYIIVNDGSTEELDDIVKKFMDEVSFPVMYIKKDNGGVHTARNIAIRYGRGEMQAGLDSDDELAPNALERLISVWDSLPDKERFREVICCCVDQNGDFDGEPYPDNINEVSRKERFKLIHRTKGEKYGFHVMKIMKENPWPEPEGITFVGENILWEKLNREYDSYCINDTLRIYHLETETSYSNHTGRKRDLQYIKNNKWNKAYMLNRPEVYMQNWWDEVVTCLKYCVTDKILILSKKPYKTEIHPLSCRLLCAAMYLPSFLGAIIYMKKHM